METLLDAKEVTVGFHPDGYRIDKNASPMNRYTKWTIRPGNQWCDPKSVCFHSLPESGWIAAQRFDWDTVDSEGKADII